MNYEPLKVRLDTTKQPMRFDINKSIPIMPYKAYVEPPTQIMSAMGFKDKPQSLTYDLLYSMSVRNSVIGAIINTRVNQVSSFTKPARFNLDNLGYTIRPRDPEKTPDDHQQAVITALEKFIENCGFEKDRERDGFDAFIRKTVRDSLTYDQLTFEILRDRRGLPAEFIAVDASTIRAATKQNQANLDDDPHFETFENGDIKYVQVIEGEIVAGFTADELAFCVRNPRSSIYMQPYGFSELEQLVTQITSHLYAEDYNSKFFSQGGITKGIINLKQDPNGMANNNLLESFRKEWNAQLSGMNGAWKTPVMQLPGNLEYVNISQSNREMEFEKWMNYLINICCAVYQIDPAEVNFPNNGGVSGTGGGIFESSNESRIKHSRDKGLRPLLRFVESIINEHIISCFSDEYVFSFVGIDARGEEEQINLDNQAVKSYKTVNEIRAEHGMEPIANGDIILDPAFISFIQQGYCEQNEGGESFSGLGFLRRPDDEKLWDDEDSNEYSNYLDEIDTEELDDEEVSKSYSELIITLED